MGQVSLSMKAAQAAILHLSGAQPPINVDQRQ
jgi:hypothetical protein